MACWRVRPADRFGEIRLVGKKLGSVFLIFCFQIIIDLQEVAKKYPEGHPFHAGHIAELHGVCVVWAPRFCALRLVPLPSGPVHA